MVKGSSKTLYGWLVHFPLVEGFSHERKKYVPRHRHTHRNDDCHYSKYIAVHHDSGAKRTLNTPKPLVGQAESGTTQVNTELEIKCKCGVITYSDAERISHDCDYYPHDIMVREELWGDLA